jgi:hypothetical protein
MTQYHELYLHTIPVDLGYLSVVSFMYFQLHLLLKARSTSYQKWREKPRSPRDHSRLAGCCPLSLLICNFHGKEQFNSTQCWLFGTNMICTSWLFGRIYVPVILWSIYQSDLVHKVLFVGYSSCCIIFSTRQGYNHHMVS